LYNLKVYNYYNSVEYRIFHKPIEENKTIKNELVGKSRYDRIVGEDGQVKFVDKDGRERDIQSIRHSYLESQKRSKQMVLEYLRANKWDWFVTLTFAPDKADRYNYDDCYKKLKNWLNRIKQKKCTDIKYLFIPEQHKDGAWHFHGVIACADEAALGIFQGAVPEIYNITSYKLGFSSASRVKDSKRVSTYVSKYMTKALIECTYGRHRYIRSSNLQSAEVMDYNITPEELQKLKLQLIGEGAWYKQVKGDYGISMTYINIDK